MLKKQAVVLIHGIGEQVPMDTLRSFVHATWVSDTRLRRPKVPSTAWSKPDNISGSFELRRLTTAENQDRRRTDFFEFYWAHLMQGTQLGHVRAWLGVLLFRRPSRILPQFRGIWWTIVILGIVAVFAASWHFLIAPLPGLLIKIGGALWFLFGSTLIFFLTHYAGDAARYLHVAPPNIQSRMQIREAGIDLLEKLHQSGEYDRIILVGHSLGSVIGFDILTCLWPRYHNQHKPTAEAPGCEALLALEKQVQDGFNIDSYQDGQTALLQEIQRQNSKWLVSDFITLGSPLAHARMLMARNEEEFRRKQEEREFPCCPPVREQVKGEGRFSFESEKGVWIPHHAAVCAVTRWTNLYFPCRHTLYGDVIGGPVAPAFGCGIKDIPVETTLRGELFTHTLYWTMPKEGEAPEHIQLLRQAIRICERLPLDHESQASKADLQQP